jgi:hypothetical protein
LRPWSLDLPKESAVIAGTAVRFGTCPIGR